MRVSLRVRLLRTLVGAMLGYLAYAILINLVCHFEIIDFHPRDWLMRIPLLLAVPFITLFRDYDSGTLWGISFFCYVSVASGSLLLWVGSGRGAK